MSNIKRMLDSESLETEPAGTQWKQWPENIARCLELVVISRPDLGKSHMYLQFHP